MNECISKTVRLSYNSYYIAYCKSSLNGEIKAIPVYIHINTIKHVRVLLDLPLNYIQ